MIQDHVKIIGILWIAFGAFSLIGAGILFLLLFGISFVPTDPIATGILRLAGFLLSSFLALLGLPKIIGGIGLLKRAEWGRIVVLAVSFLSLLNIPLGTALGIYSIVILFKPEAVAYFRPDVSPRP